MAQTPYEWYNQQMVNKRKRMTAVEWLVNEVNSDCLNSAFIRPELVEQANKMFEEQIMESRNNGIVSTLKGYSISNEDYYKETFNK
jgi:hypothetical protein